MSCNHSNGWSPTEMEQIDVCPFCQSQQKELIFDDVEDWAFQAVIGQWQYWECQNCLALYLNPRPKESLIGRAYTNYYTHESVSSSWLQHFKLKLKNAILANKYKVTLTPSLTNPFIQPFLRLFRPYIYEPYGIQHLQKENNPGTLLDVGCGSGLLLSIAKQYGWKVTGIELDTNAVKTANKKGLNVIEGGYQQLEQFSEEFDIINCSHVLEHVFSPKDLLDKIKRALKPNGALMLSLPNANSYLKDQYQSAWRGLEAPRHICIPTSAFLANYLKAIGFDVHVDFDPKPYTKKASQYLATKFHINIKKQPINKANINTNNQDFICIIAKKSLQK